jgi:hypothetical protein
VHLDDGRGEGLLDAGAVVAAAKGDDLVEVVQALLADLPPQGPLGRSVCSSVA